MSVKTVGCVLAVIYAVFLSAFAQDELLTAFRHPPAVARPYIWWHWMNGNVTKAGITADLESMAKVGLGGVQLFDVGLEIPKGPIAFGSAGWYEHVAFAARECERLGMSFGIANCSGWTGSGGPWVTPEYAMKFVTTVVTNVCGPAHVSVPNHLVETNGYYRDIALLAFPSPPVKAEIPDLPRQVLRVRGDESGPVGVPLISQDVFPSGSCVEQDRILDLTARLVSGGLFEWRAPAGAWTLLRVGFVCNGRRNRPPSASGDGLETDKLSRKATDIHFDSYVARVAAAVGRGHAFDNVLVDSYEVNGQNWTQGFELEFVRRRGYSLVPYLPVLAGYPVASASATRKFLADYRKTIGELFVENYAGRFAERCHSLGLKFACEPYGNGPFNDLAYAAKCDIPMCEFWTQRGDGVSMWTRWGHRYNGNARIVAAAARFWGRDTIGAEAFTAYPTETSGRWLEHPASMKAQGDRVLADGVNRFYFHRYAHQPWTNPTRYPGMTMAYYGSHFERTQTWWNNGFKAYVCYLSRIQALLRRGSAISDILVCCPDDVPSFGNEGEIPDGWKADRCTETDLKQEKDKDPRFEARYRLVVRPNEDIMKLLHQVGCERDFSSNDGCISWTHRRDGDDELYFVATSAKEARRVRCSFRDFSHCAEVWHPESDTIEVVDFVEEDGRAVLDIDLLPEDSCFVVFRKVHTVGVRKTPRYDGVGSTLLTGPWKVSFYPPGEAKPIVQTNFVQLTDWTSSSDKLICNFSGTAQYDIHVPCTLPEGGRTVLDLGQVYDIAEVWVEDKAIQTLWRPPFRVDVTDVVKGRKEISLGIRITNRWPNRLIGDEQTYGKDMTWRSNNRWGRPILADFPRWTGEGTKMSPRRSTFTTCRLWCEDDELLPSGLLGPVRLIHMCKSSD